MTFLGNPGTGKTTVARLVARMLRALGVLAEGHLVEVTRRDLIGSHHGETGHLTADACKRAAGGVLFVDEAYALRHEGSSDSAGQARAATRLAAVSLLPPPAPLAGVRQHAGAGGGGARKRARHHPRWLHEGDDHLPLHQPGALVPL